MDRLWAYIFIILVILSGAFTLPTCIDYLKARSSEENRVSDVVKKQLPPTKDCYTITYDLDSGEISDANPTTYNLFTETFTLNNPTKEGYVFLGWTGTDLSTPQLKVTICKGSAGDLSFNANFSIATYSIEYDLDGGVVSLENPATYDMFTETFTLNNPTKEGFEFLGWTGTNIDSPSLNVKIPKGSVGNLSFKANFKILVDIPDFSIEQEESSVYIVFNHHVENVTQYIVDINGDTFKITDTMIQFGDSALTFDGELSSRYFIDSVFLNPGINNIRIKAVKGDIVGLYSNITSFTLPEAKKTIQLSYVDGILRFKAVDNAIDYWLRVGNCYVHLFYPSGLYTGITFSDGYYSVDISGNLNGQLYLAFFGEANSEFINSDTRSVDVSISCVCTDSIVRVASNTVTYVYTNK